MSARSSHHRPEEVYAPESAASLDQLTRNLAAKLGMRAAPLALEPAAYLGRTAEQLGPLFDISVLGPIPAACTETAALLS